MLNWHIADWLPVATAELRLILGGRVELDVLATGFPSLDRIFRVHRAAAVGQTAPILESIGLETATPGGCAPNIAVACARLGLRAGVLIVLGDDRQGHEFVSSLTSEGVETDRGVQVVPGKTPRTYLFAGPDGRHQTFFYPGVSGGGDIPIRLDDSLATGTRWGVITIGNPVHNGSIATWLSSHNVPMLWGLKNDPNAYPLTLVQQMVDKSRVVVLNEDEANELTRLLNLSSVEHLLDFGPETIFRTRGCRGSRTLCKAGVSEIPAVQPTEIVDPTGAGDAYTAGVLWGLCSNLPPAICGRIGAVVASFVLEKWGCQTNLPGQAQVRQRYNDAFGEEMPVQSGE